MSNQSHNSDSGRVWDPNSEIGVWDPTTVGKSNTQPPANQLPQNYGTAAPSQASWHSQPGNSSASSDFNLSAIRNTLPYQSQQPPVQPALDNNIYYTPEQQGGYIQATNPSPYSNVAGSNNNTGWSNQPSQSYAGRQPPPQQQYVPYSNESNSHKPTQKSDSFVNPLISSEDTEAAGRLQIGFHQFLISYFFINSHTQIICFFSVNFGMKKLE